MSTSVYDLECVLSSFAPSDFGQIEFELSANKVCEITGWIKKIQLKLELVTRFVSESRSTVMELRQHLLQLHLGRAIGRLASQLQRVERCCVSDNLNRSTSSLQSRRGRSVSATSPLMNIVKRSDLGDST